MHIVGFKIITIVVKMYQVNPVPRQKKGILFCPVFTDPLIYSVILCVLLHITFCYLHVKVRMWYAIIYLSFLTMKLLFVVFPRVTAHSTRFLKTMFVVVN